DSTSTGAQQPKGETPVQPESGKPAATGKPARGNNQEGAPDTGRKNKIQNRLSGIIKEQKNPRVKDKSSIRERLSGIIKEQKNPDSSAPDSDTISENIARVIKDLL
ncbi:MAG: hypothetical protein LUE64_04260, partial [Candidatus Gastranaerophilales bacterium]|nr:hypothetical protein [Candidatus Gastranaerophilales bacterium]